MGGFFFMTMSCTWSNQSWYHPGCPRDREIIVLCTWSIQSYLDRESQTQSNKRVDFFFMTMSCTWSNQSWHCPLLLMIEKHFLSFVWIQLCLVLGPINLIQIERVGFNTTMGDFFFMTISCTWSNQSWYCPAGPGDRETLPLVCVHTTMSCTWSNQSHSD